MSRFRKKKHLLMRKDHLITFFKDFLKFRIGEVEKAIKAGTLAVET